MRLAPYLKAGQHLHMGINLASEFGGLCLAKKKETCIFVESRFFLFGKKNKFLNFPMDLFKTSEIHSDEFSSKMYPGMMGSHGLLARRCCRELDALLGGFFPLAPSLVDGSGACYGEHSIS